MASKEPGDCKEPNQDPLENLNRRNWLKLSGGLVGAVGLAGCGGGGSGDDGSSGTGGSDDDIEREQLDEIDLVVGFTQAQNPTMYEWGRLIQTQYEQLGIPSNYRALNAPQPSITARYEERDYDALVMGMSGAPYRMDPSFYLMSILHSDSANTKGTQNMSNFQSPEYDEIAEAQAEALDQEERQELVYQAQQFAWEEQAWTVFAEPHLISALNNEEFEPPEEHAVPSSRYVGSNYTLSNWEPVDDADTLVLGYEMEDIETFNPTAVSIIQDLLPVKPFYDTLTVVGPDVTPVNWLADDVAVVDDTTIEVEIKDGVQWHDGEGTVSSEDVAFSYNLHKEVDTPFLSSFYGNFEEATTDGETVVFNLSEPDASFLTITMTQSPILPKRIWDGIEEREDVSDPKNYTNEPPVGSSPWAYERYEPGQFVEWTVMSEHPHAPNYDKMRMNFYSSKSTAVEAVIQGDVHVIDVVSPALQQDIEESDSTVLSARPSNAKRAITWNMRRELPFADRAFREALSHAIPRETGVEQINQGHASIGSSIISKANEYWNNPEIEHHPYDLETARQKLEEAGYAWDDNGRLLYPTDVPTERVRSAYPDEELED